VALTWNTQLLRLTIFAEEPLPPGAFTSLWQDVIGQPPEDDDSRPREHARRQAGPVDDTIALEMQATPARIDWLMIPRPPESDPPPPHFASIDAGLTKAEALFIPWLAGLNFRCSRLAFGAVFLAPVSSRLDGYQAILDLVPSLRFTPNEDVSDLLFQINRPQASAVVPNSQINCLMKWSVAKVMRFQLTLGESNQTSSAIGSEEFCRLELDINTKPLDPPLQTSLDATSVAPIFAEFTSIARQKAQHGEL
jgi:hypothetical protein